jgi:hypothetical protein
MAMTRGSRGPEREPIEDTSTPPFQNYPDAHLLLSAIDSGSGSSGEKSKMDFRPSCLGDLSSSVSRNARSIRPYNLQRPSKRSRTATSCSYSLLPSSCRFSSSRLSISWELYESVSESDESHVSCDSPKPQSKHQHGMTRYTAVACQRLQLRTENTKSASRSKPGSQT